MLLVRGSLCAHSKGDIQMKRALFAVAAFSGLAVGQAHANTVGIQLSGAGISGTVVVSYGTATRFQISWQGV